MVQNDGNGTIELEHIAESDGEQKQVGKLPMQ